MIEYPRKHHFIPAFYLKNWAIDDGYLIEYSRPYHEIRPHRRHPNASAYQRDLYSFNELPSDIAQQLESNFLKPTDSIADVVLKRMLAGDLNIYEPELRNAWSRFLISLQLRHPDAIADLRVDIPRILAENQEQLEASYRQIRKPADPVTYSEYVRGLDPLAWTRIHLYTLQATLDSKLGGQRLNNLNWGTLGVGNAACPLLTSDWPVCFNADGKGIVLFPLSPQIIFAAAPDNNIIRGLSRRRPDELVTIMNSYVVSHARRYVFASDERQTRFIEIQMSTRMRPRPLFPLAGKGFGQNE